MGRVNSSTRASHHPFFLGGVVDVVMCSHDSFSASTNSERYALISLQEAPINHPSAHPSYYYIQKEYRTTMAKFSFLLAALVACLVALSATAFAPMSKYLRWKIRVTEHVGISFHEGRRNEDWTSGVRDEVSGWGTKALRSSNICEK